MASGGRIKRTNWTVKKSDRERESHKLIAVTYQADETFFTVQRGNS
jgi:hypothetical protein